MEERTTIQISEDMRKKLKVLASYRDLSYNEILDDMIAFFENSTMFTTERDFSVWFENNLDKFGFKEIIEKRLAKSPDYKLRNNKGKIVEVELELIGKDFERHGHDPKKTDLIICLYSNEKKIKGVPVISVIENDPRPMMIREHNYTTVSVPINIAEQIKKDMVSKGFKSVSDFVTHVLRSVILGDSNKKIMEDLKKLGYID